MRMASPPPPPPPSSPHAANATSSTSGEPSEASLGIRPYRRHRWRQSRGAPASGPIVTVISRHSVLRSRPAGRSALAHLPGFGHAFETVVGGAGTPTVVGGAGTLVGGTVAAAVGGGGVVGTVDPGSGGSGVDVPVPPGGSTAARRLV